MFRADAEGKNGYSAEVDKSSGKLLLKRFTNDRSEVVKEISLTPIQIKADSIKLKVKAEGQKLWVYANGEPLLEVEDSFYGNGYFGLRNQLGVSVFRDMSFSNTSDFQTNITGWQAKSGKWEKSLDGVKAAASGRSIYLSNEKGSRFGYKTDMKMNTKGIGGLLFRADKEGKNGYYAELDGGRKRLQLIKLNNGKRTVMNVRNVPLEKESNTLEVRADGVQLNVLLNGQKVMEQNDSSFADGYFGLVSTGPNTSFQNVRKELNAGDVPAEIENPDFEKGSLEGWVPMEGNAFANAQVTRADTYWGGTFDHQGSYHMWGAAEIGDDPQGSMRSSYFKLGGSGEINFLIGGGNDRENLHVSLMRASDNQELIRAHNSKWAEDEKYRRVEWDASNYLGETVYIKVTDKKSGGWGHINVDDFHVFNEGPLPENPDNDPGELPVLPYEPKTSGKLTEWNTLEGEWAEGTEGSYGGIWECPELIQVPVEGSPAKKKWVMIVSINDGAPAGGSGVQYFTGDFDGKTFTNENPPEKALWADYGADFYAAVSWNNSPGENPIWLGWMSNWQYANDTPTAPWKSAMTVPREMVMTDTEEGYRLKQKPVDQFEDLRLEKIKFENELVVPGQNLLKNTSGDTAEIETEFSVKDAKEAGLKIRSGNGQYTKIGYDAQNKTVFIDRTHSGYDFGPNVEKIHEVSVNEKDGKIKLRILLDRSSIEVFVNDGEQVMTDQIFAAPENQGMELYSLDGSTELSYLNVYDVKRIWGSSPFRSNLSNWKAVNGQWGDTISGKLGRSGPDSFNISGDRGSNFTYSAKIKVLNEGAGALVFRADRNARNGYAVNVDTKHDLIKLMKISNGSISVLQETPYDLNPNQVYDVKVTAKGNELKAYIDGALKISSTDQQFQEGYAGLNVWNATAVFNEVMLQAE
ncbi:GH32 C-terminal domain-containing protein [Metabacillus sp. 113a]|uniref:GH32 C-terminal domain-containing protein n=1 Tax=Metabacillus sp. 113a TaxID=3404706 RepID=UPI003CE802F3